MAIKQLTVPDWTQSQLDEITAGGAPPLPPSGTLLSGVCLPSDWNALQGEFDAKQDTVSGLLPLGSPNTFPTVNGAGTALNYVYATNQSLQTVDAVQFANITSAYLKADTSSGGELRTSSGSTAVHFGSGGGANGTLYGGWNYDNGTARGVPYLGASKTITTNDYFQYDSTNSRLEVFGSLGNEKVANGTFTGSAAGWTVGTGWAYSSNTMTKNANGTGTLSQNIGVVLGELQLVSFVISNMTVSSVTVTLGGQTLGTITTNGTYTYKIAPTSTANLVFTPTNTSRFTVDTVSVKPLTGGSVTTDSLGIGGANYAPTTTKMMLNFSQSNSQPNTTRAVQFNNAGSGTFLDFYFGGTHRSSIGTDNSGTISTYSTGGNYLAHYYGSGVSWTMYAYNYPTAFVHYGYVGANAGVIAGGSYTPSSTLQTAGGLGLKVKRITSAQALDNTATHWLIDASNASACSGTPTYSCSHWTNQTDCQLRDSHGGCTWDAGSSCSVFNYEAGMSSCSGTSGCTVDTSSCSSASDQSSCESQDDYYGGSCAWTMGSNTCSGYTDYSSCDAASPCYSNNGGDCNTLSDGGSDGSACATQPQCSYDSGSGVCSGSYFTSCEGDNSTYSCTGDYNTGTCSGSYGSGCVGTSSCAGIDDSTSCGGEAGCTWSSVLNATLPDLLTYPDRTYWVYNDSSGGADVALIPYSGQTINGASSFTLSNYKDGVHISPFYHTQSCSVYVTAGTCTPTGCTPNYSACSWNSMDNTCSGNVACDGIGDQSTCESTTYFSSCSGTEIISKDWKIWSRT